MLLWQPPLRSPHSSPLRNPREEQDGVDGVLLVLLAAVDGVVEEVMLVQVSEVYSP